MSSRSVAPEPNHQRAPTEDPGFRITPRLVLAGVVGVLVVASGLFGTSWGRRELALSTTRIDDAYWELYLADPAARCPAAGTSGRLGVVVANRSTASARVSWQVVLTRAGTARTTLASTAVDLAPEQVLTSAVPFLAPAGPFTVDVFDPSRTHRLTVSCPRQAAP